MYNAMTLRWTKASFPTYQVFETHVHWLTWPPGVCPVNFSLLAEGLAELWPLSTLQTWSPITRYLGNTLSWVSQRLTSVVEGDGGNSLLLQFGSSDCVAWVPAPEKFQLSGPVPLATQRLLPGGLGQECNSFEEQYLGKCRAQLEWGTSGGAGLRKNQRGHQLLS